MCAVALIVHCHQPARQQSVTSHTASTSTRWHFAFGLYCHSNATRAPIANPPNSAQLEGTAYHSLKLHSGPCSSVGMRPRTDRHRHTDGRDQYTSRLLIFSGSDEHLPAHLQHFRDFGAVMVCHTYLCIYVLTSLQWLFLLRVFAAAVVFVVRAAYICSGDLSRTGN